jgi:hypothetical protein
MRSNIIPHHNIFLVLVHKQKRIGNYFATFWTKSSAKTGSLKNLGSFAMKPSKIPNSLRSNNGILHGFPACRQAGTLMIIPKFFNARIY